MTLPRRPGLFCAAPHPADPTILCALLSGHWPGSLHDDGCGTRWSEGPGCSDGSGSDGESKDAWTRGPGVVPDFASSGLCVIDGRVRNDTPKASAERPVRQAISAVQRRCPSMLTGMIQVMENRSSRPSERVR